LCRDRVDHIARDAQAIHDLVIEDANAVSGDGAHRQLLVARDAELTHEKDVERRPKAASHLIRDGYAATGQCEHQHVRAVGVSSELLGKQPTRLTAISKALWHCFCPFPSATWPHGQRSRRWVGSIAFTSSISPGAMWCSSTARQRALHPPDRSVRCHPWWLRRPRELPPW